MGARLYAAGSSRDVTDSGGGCRVWQNASSHKDHSSSARRSLTDVPLVESGRKSEERERAKVDKTKTATFKRRYRNSEIMRQWIPDQFLLIAW